MLKDVNELKACPDCSSNNVSFSNIREQIICRDCGLIFEPLTPQVEEQFERAHGMIKGESKRLQSKSVKSKSYKKTAVKKKK